MIMCEGGFVCVWFFVWFVLLLFVCLGLCASVYVGGKLTSRVFEDLVLGSVLFSIVITGTVKAGSSQMGKFAGVSVPQGSEEGRRE